MSLVTPIAPSKIGQIIATEFSLNIFHCPSKNVAAIKIINTGTALWCEQLHCLQLPVAHLPDPHDWHLSSIDSLFIEGNTLKGKIVTTSIVLYLYCCTTLLYATRRRSQYS